MAEKYYTVYLFKSPECIRGWLSYIEPSYSERATFKVSLKAENGPKAKNKAITLANKGFEGLDIIARNYDDEIWGINKFSELKDF